VYEPDAAVSAEVVVENRGGLPADVSAIWTIQANPQFVEPPSAAAVPLERATAAGASIPELGVILAGGTATAKIQARESSRLTLDVGRPLPTGCYLLGIDVRCEGQRTVGHAHLFVLPVDTAPVEKARRFGVNGAEADHAASMRRCGFGWVRFENAKWMMYMPRPDLAAFDGSVGPWHVDIDGIFRHYGDSGLWVAPYVFQPPEWATSAPPEVKQNRHGYPPRSPAEYGAAVFQLVARYGSQAVDPALLCTADRRSGLGLVKAIELWNEPNLSAPGWGPFVGPLERYFDVLRAGAEGSRRADPTLPVSAAGWAGLDLDVVGRLAEHRYDDGRTPLDLVDIVNVHFYSGREEPERCGWDPNVDRDGPLSRGETYPEMLEALVAWRDRHKPAAELWLGEIGNDVGGPMGGSERDQAARLPRGVMLALAAGIDRVFVYREKGSDPTQHAGSGLLRNDGSVRPSWLTIATMIRQLQGVGGRGVRLPHPDGDVWIFLWRDGGRRLVTAWTVGKPVRLGLPLGTVTACDAFGRTTPDADAADVVIGPLPTYLSLAAETPEVARLVAEASARDAARVAERERLESVAALAFDFGTAEHVGVLKGLGLPRRFTAVGHDRLWDPATGYGFLRAGMQVDDSPWIASSLDRDGVRLNADIAFRVRMPPGRQRVRLSATPLGKNGLSAKLAAGGQEFVTRFPADAAVVETVLDGDRDLTISLDTWSILRWLTVIPEAVQSR